MKILMSSTIEWKDGAVLKVQRLSKKKEQEISTAIEQGFSISLEDAKLEEAARIELAAKRDELKITPDEEGKARLENEIKILVAIANKSSKRLATRIGLAAMEASISGWENILDENDQPLEYNDTTLGVVAASAFEDSAVLDKILTFIRGPLGN